MRLLTGPCNVLGGAEGCVDQHLFQRAQVVGGELAVATHLLQGDVVQVGSQVFAALARKRSRSTPTTLAAGPCQRRDRVYIGETDNLSRRLAGNYRNPGPSQQTSLRVNAILRQHLRAAGVVRLAVTTEVMAPLAGGDEQGLDLTRKAARLVAESATLVLAQVSDDADIENFG